MKNKQIIYNDLSKKIMHIIKAETFDVTKMINLKISDKKMILSSDAVYGEYESNKIDTINFSSLVASWSSTSSNFATVELLVSIRVNGIFSDYISYCKGGWGLGLHNVSKNHKNEYIELNVDEINVLNYQVGDAIKFKLIIRRSDETVTSPVLSLVTFALQTNESLNINNQIVNVLTNIKYNVPCLYQGVVPDIGNSICSPTSVTMLLKYKKMNFLKFDHEFEHRYLAEIVKDYGNNIYGNWAYNVATMGGYGFNAYVARFSSIEELIYHLNTVGPVAISVKGQMKSNLKDYYTAGHLLCIIGYFYQENNLFFIANDPNVSEVECQYSANVIKGTWRNIVYVIE